MYSTHERDKGNSISRFDMNKLILVLFIGVLILASLACGPVQTDNNITITSTAYSSPLYYRYYYSLSELYADSVMVTLGTVDRVVSATDRDMGQGFNESQTWLSTLTEYAFRIERVFKGNQAEEISLFQVTGDRYVDEQGEEVSVTFIHSADNIPFQPGERYILFLRASEPGRFSTVGGPMGKFIIVSGKVFSMDKYITDEKVTRGVSVNGEADWHFLSTIDSLQTGEPQ